MSVFSCFKFIDLFIKVIPQIIKIGFGTNFFGKTFVLQSVSCSKVMRIHRSWLNEKLFSYIFNGSIVTFYLLCPKWGKWVIYSPKINTFPFHPSNFSWKSVCYWFFFKNAKIFNCFAGQQQLLGSSRKLLLLLSQMLI